jgi:hypothetical protein
MVIAEVREMIDIKVVLLQSAHSWIQYCEAAATDGECSGLSTEKRGLRCLSFYARSIVTKMPDLFYVVDVLRPDIVGITETWADDTASDVGLGIAGFDLYRKDRGNGRRSDRGVALYVKNLRVYCSLQDFPRKLSFRSMFGVGF